MWNPGSSKPLAAGISIEPESRTASPATTDPGAVVEGAADVIDDEDEIAESPLPHAAATSEMATVRRLHCTAPSVAPLENEHSRVSPSWSPAWVP